MPREPQINQMICAIAYFDSEQKAPPFKLRKWLGPGNMLSLAILYLVVFNFIYSTGGTW